MARGSRKTHLSRLQLALLGKGPTDRTARVMAKEAAKSPGGGFSLGGAAPKGRKA